MDAAAGRRIAVDMIGERHMEQTGTGPDLANSVDTLAKAVEKLQEKMDRGIAAAAPIPEEALLAANRFRDILRGLQLRLPLALLAEATSATEVRLTWTVDEPELAPTKLLRCEGDECTSHSRRSSHSNQRH
jgi:hypothetical protein